MAVVAVTLAKMYLPACASVGVKLETCEEAPMAVQPLETVEVAVLHEYYW